MTPRDHPRAREESSPVPSSQFPGRYPPRARLRRIELPLGRKSRNERAGPHGRQDVLRDCGHTPRFVGDDCEGGESHAGPGPLSTFRFRRARTTHARGGADSLPDHAREHSRRTRSAGRSVFQVPGTRERYTRARDAYARARSESGTGSRFAGVGRHFPGAGPVSVDSPPVPHNRAPVPLLNRAGSVRCRPGVTPVPVVGAGRLPTAAARSEHRGPGASGRSARAPARKSSA